MHAQPFDVIASKRYQLHRKEPMRSLRISFVGKRVPVHVIVEPDAITLEFPKNGDGAKDGGPLIVLTDKD
jgi:hypothetical protein